MPHLALIGVQVMFGTWPIFGKIVLRSMSSISLVGLRICGAALIFAILKPNVGEFRQLPRRVISWLVFSSLLEAGKQLERVFADNIFAFDTGDVLHRAIPGGVPALAIESDNAIDVRLEEAFEKEILFLGLVGHWL